MKRELTKNTLFDRVNKNVYLIVYDKYRKEYYTYYYDTEFEKDKAKRRFYFNNRYIVDSDSTDRFWSD